MAVCIMFGLTVAAILALIVTPVLYATFYRIHEGDARTGAEPLTPPAAPHGTQPA
jgi:Cu/Ag efflux pump CusA